MPANQSNRTIRMHVVPRSYLEAFAVDDASRRSPAIWRFYRSGSPPKLLATTVAEVENDMYTFIDANGNPDIGIEKILGDVEGHFCASYKDIHNELLDNKGANISFSKEVWSGLTRFVAAQLMRTPRNFQAIQSLCNAKAISYDRNTLLEVMLNLIERWISRITRMDGQLMFNRTDLSLLTSDNPAAVWRINPDYTMELGGKPNDQNLVVSCPLSPALLFVAYQTPASLQAVYAEQFNISKAERVVNEHSHFKINVKVGEFTGRTDISRMNRLCVANAHNHVYSAYSDSALVRFFENNFYGSPAPIAANVEKQEESGE